MLGLPFSGASPKLESREFADYASYFRLITFMQLSYQQLLPLFSG
jgi:hypothetical protein